MSLIVNQAYASSFACIKCNGIPKLCMTDEDGELLCNKCAENIDNTMINKGVQNMVNKLKTKCLTLSQDPNYIKKKNNNEQAEGINVLATQISNQSKCDWIGKIQDYDTHSKECEFVIVNCKECKIFKCQRKLLNKHIIKCPKVKINCPLACGLIIFRKNETIHIETECEEQLLNCTNDDCKQEIKRKDFKHHIENICDTRIIQCKFKQFGCNIQNIKANQLNIHMNNYKFEHLSLKFDAVTNKLSAKITEQQKTIDYMKSQLEEKESGIDKLNKYIETIIGWNNLSTMSGIVHDCDVRILVNTGWKCVYDKPYSHVTTTNELRGLCDENKDIFVGGYHKDNKNNIILGAFGPSSVLHKFIGSTSKAVIPSDVTYKTVYKVYWYHLENKSFGFASVSKVNCDYPDCEDANGDDRLSWYLYSNNGGYRLGSKKRLNNNDYYKIIYMK